MIFLLQATTLLLLLQATAMVQAPCVVLLQVNILLHHLFLDLEVLDRLLAQLLLGLLHRLLLLGLAEPVVLLVTGIGIIGWEGKGWISHLRLLGMIEGLLEDIRMVEVVAGMDVETRVTVGMECLLDLENLCSLFFEICFLS